MTQSKSLVLIRGVMGSGKSTLAKMYVKDDYLHLEADMYFISPLSGEYEFKAELLYQAHSWCQSMAEHFMAGDKKVVVSNTFIKRKDMKPYFELAEKYGYIVQEIICRGRFQNEHGVPEEVVLKKMEAFEL